MDNILEKTPVFIFLTLGIYGCYLTASLLHQRILKEPFIAYADQHHKYYNGFSLFLLVSSGCSSIIGKSILKYREIRHGQPALNIPYKKIWICALITNITNATFTLSIIFASYPAIIMVKSCSLLSVILVGVFCSGLKDKKLKLTKEKIVVGLIATLGIFLFNYKKQQQRDSNNHPLSLFSVGSLLLLVSIVGDGFVPDYQAQIKSEYKPTPIQMYYNINKMVFMFCFLISCLTGEILKAYHFARDYQGFLIDIGALGLLNSVGQLFIYKMIKQFRQHVTPFVVASRKCLTVLVNLIIFGHTIDFFQGLGMVIVFISIFLEICSNLRSTSVSLKSSQNQHDESSDLKLSEQIISTETQQREQSTASIQQQSPHPQNQQV